MIDLNSTVEDEELCEISLAQQSEIEFSSLTIEEMESRLEVGQPMVNKLVAYGLYCIYARAKGFSVRKGNAERYPDGSGIKAKDFLCHCQGNKDEKRSHLNIPACQKPTYRCNCKAKLRVGRLKGQNWRVTSFKKDHNHDMFPSDQTYLLRTSRHMTAEMEQCIETMVACGIPVARAYEFLQTSANGRENVGIIQKDIYNSRARAKKESIIENGDAAQLVQHFMERSNKEPYFYWNVERDENKRILNVFVRDYRCFVDYEHFGDTLSIDTTYRTNIYNMICCPFVGINHHKQNVFFGFAFMSDETERSFEWLFRTFLESMGGNQPETVFTDQCQAMINAVETVFSKSHHLLCHWHINQNAPSHFGSLNGDKDFKKLWHKCMTGCQDVEEFEATWKQMVDKYNIGENSWFTKMYNIRDKWATAFSCHRFCAGLKATSRSEGTNSAFKRNLVEKLLLYDCVIGYEKVQESWRMDEKEKDTRSHHGKLPVGKIPWLIQVAELYTMEIFSLFQNEVSESMGYSIVHQQEVVGTRNTLFSIKSRGGSSRIMKVEFNRDTTSVTCSCHKFETVGILCCHVLKVFDRINLHHIPEQYIKPRWTKSAKNRLSSGSNDNIQNAKSSSDIAFVHEYVRKSYALATRAQSSKEAKCILTKAHEEAKLQLDALFKTLEEDDLAAREFMDVNENDVEDDVIVRDPKPVRCRGLTDAHMRHWETTKGSTLKSSANQNVQRSEVITNNFPMQTPRGMVNYVQPMFQPFVVSQSASQMGSIMSTHTETNFQHQFAHPFHIAQPAPPLSLSYGGNTFQTISSMNQECGRPSKLPRYNTNGYPF